MLTSYKNVMLIQFYFAGLQQHLKYFHHSTSSYLGHIWFVET